MQSSATLFLIILIGTLLLSGCGSTKGNIIKTKEPTSKIENSNTNQTKENEKQPFVGIIAQAVQMDDRTRSAHVGHVHVVLSFNRHHPGQHATVIPHVVLPEFDEHLALDRPRGWAAQIEKLHLNIGQRRA